MRAALTVLLVLWSAAAMARDLKFATWDLGWFTLRAPGDTELPEGVLPKTLQDVARLRRYAAVLDADVVALQGIDGPAAAAMLFPPDQYDIEMTSDTMLQRTGFAVRRTLAFHPFPDLSAANSGARRPPIGADIALALPDGGTLRVLSLHLKSGCRDLPLDTPDRPDCATLARQATALRGWIGARERTATPFLLLGDFSRVMDDADDFRPLLGDRAALQRADAGRASPCWGGERFVDHIIAGGGAAAWLQPGTLRVLAYRETEAAWRARLSTHCPVSVRLSLPD